MGYLRSRDYEKQIQTDNLTQVLSKDDGLRLLAESEAEEEIVSYLVQKYDVASEFTDTNAWSHSLAYSAGARFELNYAIYDATKSYLINDLTTYNSVCYICTGGTTGAFDNTKWTVLGNLYDLFYAKYPQPIFDLNTVYKVGDQVWWANNVYTCKIATVPLDHNSTLQFGQYFNVPDQNVFPNDPLNGLQFWGTPTVYVVTAGTLPTNAAFVKADNRSQQIVMSMIDITLYHLHSRIAPRNIPQLRQSRYDMAIDWLNKANTGTITAKITLLQPKQGRAIRSGGNIKNINNY